MLYFFSLYATTVMIIMVDACWLVANRTGRGDRVEKTRGKVLQFKHNLNNGIQ